MSFPPIACPVDLLPWQGYFQGLVFGAGTPFPLLEISQGYDMVPISSQDSQYPRGQGDFIGLDVSKGRTIDMDFWVAPTYAAAPSTYPAPGTPTVTPEGTTGSTGWTYGVTYLSPDGETTVSPLGSTANGNATLSSTNYNELSWAAVSPTSGNLVYDSNLQNALAPLGPTWYTSGVTIGPANGDFNVVNAGTDQAEWVYYGTGSAEAEQFVMGVGISVTPGATYTLAAVLDGTNMASDSAMSLTLWEGVPPVLRVGLGGVAAGGGSKQSLATTFTVPVGVTSIFPALGINYNVGGTVSGTTIVTAGETISWSQIQITEGSSAEPYSPGPLWTYNIYRQSANLYQIGYTTCLAFDDTGQQASAKVPPSPMPRTIQQLMAQLSQVFQVQGNIELPMWYHLPGWGVLGFMVRTRKRSFPINLAYSAAGLAKPKVEMYATDPLGYGPTQIVPLGGATGSVGVSFPITFPVTFSVQSSGTVLTNDGNFRVFPQVTFTGPLVTPTLSLNGYTFTLYNPNQGSGMTIDEGETVTVDFHTHSVLFNVTGTPQQTAVNSWVVFGSSYFPLAPGANNVIFTSGAGSTGSVSVSYASGFYL